jgi:hypothetical protein
MDAVQQFTVEEPYAVTVHFKTSHCWLCRPISSPVSRNANAPHRDSSAEVDKAYYVSASEI